MLTLGCDKQGNYFCFACGAGYDVKPHQCFKCIGSSSFVSVGSRWYGREIIMKRKMKALKRASVVSINRDYEVPNAVEMCVA